MVVMMPMLVLGEEVDLKKAELHAQDMNQELLQQ